MAQERIQIYLTKPELKGLKLLKKKTGKSIADLIRRAIDKVYFDRELKNEQHYTSSKK